MFYEALTVANVRSHMSSGEPNVPDSAVPPLPVQSSTQAPSIAGMDGVVGLEPVETGQKTKRMRRIVE